MNHGLRNLLAAVLASLVAALAGAAQASAACPNAGTIPTAENIPEIRAALICLHNEAREAADVAPLRSNDLLTTAAQWHSDDMVVRKYFAHDTPDGVDPFRRMKRAGYISSTFVWNAGETIAWGSGGYVTPRQIVEAWLDATSQRLTLLAPDFRDIGVGVTLGAPVERDPDAPLAVTYTVDYGWRTNARRLRLCLRRASKRRRTANRRLMRAKCHGLERPADLASSRDGYARVAR